MAQSQLRWKKAQVFVVEETSQDTFETPGDSDVFLAQEVTYGFDAEFTEQQVMLDGGLVADPVIGKRSATLSFKCPIAGSGATAPTTAPGFAEALKACGLAQSSSGVPVDTFTYTPLLTFDGAGGNPGPSYSAGVLVDGNRYALKGGFSNLQVSLVPGSIMTLQFDFQGAYSPMAADALLSPTYITSIPLAFLGATASMNFGGAYTPRVREITFDLGNTITLGVDGNDAQGYYGARIVGRNPTGSIQLEADAQGTQDWYSILVADTPGTITTGTIGSTAGNQFKFDVARAHLQNVELQDNEGIVGHSLPFTCASQATDVEGTNDPITLTFT